MVESSKPQVIPSRPSRLDNVHSNIFTPKLFLVELIETILRENTIACLVNDTGKHFLFVTLLKRLAHRIRGGRKVALFVASSDQQAAIMFKCIAINSVFNVNIYNDPTAPLPQERQVIVATAPNALTMLDRRFLTQNEIDLVVFDECHLAVERGSTYFLLAKRLCDPLQDSSDSLRILAVTSSILNEQCWNPLELQNLVTNLEKIFKAKAEVAPELVPSMASQDPRFMDGGLYNGSNSLGEDESSNVLDPNVSQSQKLELLTSEGLKQRPKESIVYCQAFIDATGLCASLDAELLNSIEFVDDIFIAPREGETKDPLHSVKLALNECRHILHELGPWCASAVSKAFNKQLGKLESCEDDSQVKRLLNLAATIMRVVNKIVDDYFDKNVNTLEEFMALTSSKVVSLIQVLHQQKPDDSFTIIPGNYDNDFTGNTASDDEMTNAVTSQSIAVGSDDEEDGVVSHEAWSRGGRAQAAMGCVVFRKDGIPEQEEEEMQCLVFVERKHVAYALNKLIVELCNWDVDLYFVRSHYVASACQTSNVTDGASTEVQRQEEVMRKFRTKELNLLVSTAALEGGIELPRCNLVIRFTPSLTYKSYVQSKAKARSLHAKFVHLVDPIVKETFESDFCAFKGIEKILFNRCRHQQKLHSGHFYLDPSMADSLMPSFCPNTHLETPAKVTMTTAIKTINRYCAKLPSDTFTHLAPKCCIEEVANAEGGGAKMFRANLKLPINSPIKQVVAGPLMPSIQLAKMGVALEMCKVLHQSRELDDNLQPISKDYSPASKDEDDDDDAEWEEPVGGQGQMPRPGSTKRKQYYKKKMAAALQGFLCAGQSAHLYAFCMTLTGPITEEQNTRGRVINAPESTSRGFGLLSPKLLQHIPHFPVFTRSGEVTVKVDLVTNDIILDQLQLDRLQAFHRFIFSQVLKLEKSPMNFDPHNAESGCIVLPTYKHDDGKIVIDWPFIKKVEIYPPPTAGNRFKPSYSSKTTSNYKSKNISHDNSLTGDMGLNCKDDVRPVNGWGELNIKSGRSKKQWVTNDDSSIESSTSEADQVPDAEPSLDHVITENKMSNQEHQSIKKVNEHLNKADDVDVEPANNFNSIKSSENKFHFDENLFADAVVTPSYRNVDQPQYFYVAEIRRDLSLSSPFPSPELYETFRHYYASKYGLVTTNENQPLLDVDHTSARLNLLTPRYVNQKGVALPITSLENRRAKRESLQQKQILVPELCYVHPFPASLWQKAVCIPTILYRINYLLIADELRIKIVTEACQKNLDELLRASPADLGLQFRFAADGEITSILAVSRRSGRRTCGEEDAGKILTDANSSDSDSGIESNGENATSNNLISECMSQSHSEANEISSPNSRPEGIDPPASQNSSLDCDSSSLGPSACDIIQTLTMSNANDFFNLERLETIGDSFLKFAITVYLYCTFPGIHEGKLSYLRSVQVSNYNLYLLGRKNGLPECMVASKFEPIENWLPPCYSIRTSDLQSDALNWKNPTKECGVQEKVQVEDYESDGFKMIADERGMSENASITAEHFDLQSDCDSKNSAHHQQIKFEQELEEYIGLNNVETTNEKSLASSSSQSSRIVIPYNLQMEHSLPDKSIADCVEALIGCYLACADQNTALRLMAWLGLKVLPVARDLRDTSDPPPDHQSPKEKHLAPPPSPLLCHLANPVEELDLHLQGYEEFEDLIQYKFKDRSYLLQAFTHASFHCNEVTDCYQRLEFLGDAILDYVITRHLFEDSIEHSPGILTDLRSALVNNNIFAFLAVKWNYHKYLKYIAPQLFAVIEKFVSWFEMRGEEAIIDDVLDGESWFDESFSQTDNEEDIEVPKVLGDVFESVAGAIYLDSGLSLDTVWTVYRRLMDRHISVFLKKIPKSPVRELLESEPETAKFEKPERTLDGRFRVTVNIVGKGVFKGSGRNYRIAKTAAAKRALKHLKLFTNDL